MATALDEELQAEVHPGTGTGAGSADPAAIAFDGIVRRLSRQSVDKHFEAYTDVDWDAPEMAIDPADPRWEIGDWHPVGMTEWYQNLPLERRTEVGLHTLATAMRTGWEFENVLQRGLLTFAYRLGNNRPEFRYLHHEVIEESQHTMMFQEFVNRCERDRTRRTLITGLPRHMKRTAELFVIPLSRRFPPLFFFFVLGGEDPVDHLQRQCLHSDNAMAPIARRIMKIHVTEEARHLSFARHYLKVEVPKLSRLRRLVLSLVVPGLLGVMARQMILVSPGLARAEHIPRSARRQAARDPRSRALVRDSVAKVRKLCAELGLVTPLSRQVWKRFGIWDEPAAAVTGSSPPAAPAAPAVPTAPTAPAAPTAP